MKVSVISTSSVRRVMEPAISHLPQVGGDPRAVFAKRAHNAESSNKIGCSPEYATNEHQKAPMAVPNSSIPTTSLPTGSTEATVTAPDYGGPQKRESDGLGQPNSEVGKLASEPKSLILRNVPEPPCYGLVKLSILKY